LITTHEITLLRTKSNKDFKKTFFMLFNSVQNISAVVREFTTEADRIICHTNIFDQGSVSAVIAGDDERGAAALPLLSQHGFGDRVRSSDSNGTGA
jgi:hypothetical protein